MDIGKLAFLGPLLLLYSCSSVAEKTVSPEQEGFKKSAAAICFGSAFQDAAVKADFNKAANGYMERGVNGHLF
jgi:hypothetical protein